jgi:hypothetical protein
MEEIRKFIFMADQIILIGKFDFTYKTSTTHKGVSRTHHKKRREETGMTVANHP